MVPTASRRVSCFMVESSKLSSYFSAADGGDQPSTTSMMVRPLPLPDRAKFMAALNSDIGKRRPTAGVSLPCAAHSSSSRDVSVRAFPLELHELAHVDTHQGRALHQRQIDG